MPSSVVRTQYRGTPANYDSNDLSPVANRPGTKFHDGGDCWHAGCGMRAMMDVRAMCQRCGIRRTTYDAFFLRDFRSSPYRHTPSTATATGSCVASYSVDHKRFHHKFKRLKDERANVYVQLGRRMLCYPVLIYCEVHYQHELT